ncbi:MAG: hypothetical protein V2I33_12530 [Kangiellaceae bacterium]|nr:hypothetical protein [Kangiellaceae bacterium]
MTSNRPFYKGSFYRGSYRRMLAMQSTMFYWLKKRKVLKQIKGKSSKEQSLETALLDQKLTNKDLFSGYYLMPD